MNNTTEIIAQDAAAIIERVIISGDLSKLSPQERVSYYRHVCQSLSLNEFTKPFDYITLNGKLTLYATRTATDQLRARNNVSIRPIERRTDNDLGIYIVEVEAIAPDGRVDFAMGVVNIAGLRGDGLANAFMKAETKAKRRATLSICGLGWMDETELETVPAARRTSVDDTGEIRDIAPDNSPQASDKQRGFIAGLSDKLGWNSEQMTAFAHEQRVDLVTMSKNEASTLIEQLQRLATEDTKPQPDPDIVIALKHLRDCERQTSGEPPKFTQAQAKDGRAVELEWIDSRRRLHAWITSKIDAAPGLEELDDQSLIGLAIATAGL